VGGHLHYKCRLCGQTFPGPPVPNLPAALAVVTYTLPYDKYQGDLPPMRVVHACPGARCLGLADLVGGILDRDDPDDVPTTSV
jgi:hypothetical protein